MIPKKKKKKIQLEEIESKIFVQKEIKRRIALKNKHPKKIKIKEIFFSS